MKSFKLHFFALAAAAAMLTGCMEGSVDAAGIKNNLSSAGYSVKFVEAKDYQTPEAFDEITTPANLTYYVEAAKPEKDGMFAWFFTNISAAETWWEANTVNLVGKSIQGNELKAGQQNNCVYVATAAAKTASKI